MAKPALGRGLGALLGGVVSPARTGPSLAHPATSADVVPPEPAGDAVQVVPLTRIHPSPLQPRKDFPGPALQELADSIREQGIVQPLIVRPKGAEFEIIAGERRWRAAQLAGLEALPVVVKDVAPEQMLEMALVENVQRADLNALEEALAYKQLSEEFGLTQDQIAQRVGKSRVAVANTMRLLKLPEPIKARLADGLISEGHARALLSIGDSTVQQHLLSQIIKNGLNVRQTEELVRRLLEDHPKTKQAQGGTAHRGSGADSRALEERMRRSLGTKVTLSRSKKGGTIVIHFYSEEELDAIYRRIIS
jgi:ParB family chromosome partitioning protein